MHIVLFFIISVFKIYVYIYSFMYLGNIYLILLHIRKEEFFHIFIIRKLISLIALINHIVFVHPNECNTSVYNRP